MYVNHIGLHRFVPKLKKDKKEDILAFLDDRATVLNGTNRIKVAKEIINFTTFFMLNSYGDS